MKITWKEVVQDFKLHYPNLGQLLDYWKPCGYAEVMIILKNKDRLIYNYDSKKVRFV